MGRRPLDVGTYGKIRFYSTSTGWRATTKFRDYDGITRPVERSGRTKTAAERALKEALRDRTAPAEEGMITAESRFREAAEVWLTEFRAAVAVGTRSPTSLETYEGRLNGVVLPAIAELRMRELTVARIGRLLTTVQSRQSAASAKTVRTIVSGVCAVAVRHGALRANPVRDVARLEGRKTPSRALAEDEMADLLAKLDADEVAVRHDLPDLVRWYAGTGERTGEGLAVHWFHLDLDAGTVDWAGSVIRVKGEGQRINEGKTEVSKRALALPPWLVTMLRDRRRRLAERFNVAEDELEGPVFPNSLGTLRDKEQHVGQVAGISAARRISVGHVPYVQAVSRHDLG
ncbi:hypothetical protein C8D87_10791 [Lentzea atacamensis]|uniref:Phage integrase central domain-containing protein n=1 Tax=Lentzea atacamensis TaxID=531938 RepID=A0ABX9E2C4_9PSEU|nr:site-specific integrase [Lentzea atacamensis]RAS62943.1 hypothetical protein C8D87_10791 [Lentzea atacamensis]